MHARSPAVAVADTRSDASRKIVIAALGVVFGDIGTSPLYAFRECLNPEHGIAVTQANIIGLLSLILWSLVLIISIKYVAIVLRADNRGEGGVLALSTLLSSASSNWRLWGPVSAVGVFGAALFFGDGFITPAISVLSAMEGLAVATPRLEHFVLPGAMLILTTLFVVQRRGTGAMGRMFGPVTLVWFVTLSLLGVRWIVTKPDVVFAINPLYAVQFFGHNGTAGFVVLASVFLAVTGGEALYADMGHFGRAPIRRGWFMIVLPALVLNYFGQGALLLENPGAISNPFYLMAPGWLLPIFAVLASVFLAVTGGEALYADMGHFGRAPIRRGWFMIVLPALVLNYFGQGALLLENPGAISNPFYLMAPGWLLPILIVLATAATVIASQAVISGVFSITRQALNLGYLPRLRVQHSSEEEIGQVYVPTLNWMLFAGTMTLIIVFQSSSALAGAYGIAISSTMLIDSILVIMLLRVRQWPQRRLVMTMLGLIFVAEAAFFLSNLLKFDDGGWLPIAVAILAYVLMTTWQEGRRTLNWLVAKEQMPVRDFLALIEHEPPHRVAGTAVYLASEAGGMPRALLNNLRFNRVLHQRNVLLTFVRPEVPFVGAENRVEIQNLGEGLCRIIARYGFMESPNVVAALRAADEAGVPYEPEQTVYVVGRENPVFAVGSGMPLWRKRLFAFMGRNSQLAAIHFGVPSHRLLEVSSQVRL